MIEFTLNEAFVTFAQASLGSEVMIGGALTSNIGTGSRAIFGTHTQPLSSTRLILTTAAIPESTTMACSVGVIACQSSPPFGGTAPRPSLLGPRRTFRETWGPTR